MNASLMPSAAAQWTSKGSGNGSIGRNADYEHHRLIDINELIRLTGDSRSGAYSKMNSRSASYDQDHPVGVRIGRNSVRYRLAEVLAYIESRPRVRDVGTTGEVE